MRALARGLGAVSAALDRIALAGAVTALAIMLGAALWQVVARYVFAAPPIWTEEAARRAMVWAGMLGASCAFRAMADPTLFPAMARRGGGLGAALAAVRMAGVAIFAAPVLWYSVYGANMNPARGFLGRSLDRTAEMIPVSMVWFTAAVPLAFALIVLHALAMLAGHLAGTLPAREPEKP
jgi:TRAP-type C4-dicarboxylate transport system permease small subunit